MIPRIHFIQISNILGYDRGIKVGGQCKHKLTQKKGIIVGCVKKPSIAFRIQWLPEGDISDVWNIDDLIYIEPTPFDYSKFNGKVFMKLLSL